SDECIARALALPDALPIYCRGVSVERQRSCAEAAAAKPARRTRTIRMMRRPRATCGSVGHLLFASAGIRQPDADLILPAAAKRRDRKSTRLNSSHQITSYS